MHHTLICIAYLVEEKQRFLIYSNVNLPGFVFHVLYLLSHQTQLQECVGLLDRFRQGALPPGVTDAQVKPHVGSVK